MARRDRTAERARAAGAEVIVARRQPRQGTRGPHRPRAGVRGRVHARAAARRRHAASARGGRALLERGRRAAPTSSSAQRRFERDEMPPSRYHANRIGSRVLSWFVGMPVERHAVRLPRVPRRRAQAAAAERDRYEIETEMLIKVRRRGGRVGDRAGHRRLRRAAEQAAAGARHDAHLFSGGVLSVP